MMAIDKAIILAAGASERLGEPKALVQLTNGLTLVEFMANLLHSHRLEVTVVTRENLVQPMGHILKELGAKIVLNREPEAGRTGSIQCGLRAIGDGPVLIAPVDRPGFGSETIEALLEAGTTACPVYGGRGGHPIALSASDCERVLKAAPDTPLHDLIEPQRIEVDAPHLHLNIDTPEDVEELLRIY